MAEQSGAETPPSRDPAAQASGHAEALGFVVQRHAARSPHYDLRLELDGVLKSWAVTRGPSLVPGLRRLAVEVGDHALGYAAFEGVIPEGRYGAGTVIVWDRGTWTPDGDPREGLARGRLTFELAGDRLRGRWHLVRTRPRGGVPQWLLMKGRDAFARAPGEPDVLEARTSVLSGRTNDDLAGAAGGGPARTRSNPGADRAVVRRPRRRAVSPQSTGQPR